MYNPTVNASPIAGGQVLTDPFDRDVESWFDRLERAFTETEGEADEAGAKSDSPVTSGSQDSSPPTDSSTETAPRSDLEQRVQDQVSAFAASSSPARAEPLVELLKEVSVEIRSLREEVAQARETTEEMRKLRREVDQVKAVLLRLRQLAQARRKSAR